MSPRKTSPSELEVQVQENASGWQVQLLVPGRRAQTFFCCCREDAHRFASRLQRPWPSGAPRPAGGLALRSHHR